MFIKGGSENRFLAKVPSPIRVIAFFGPNQGRMADYVSQVISDPKKSSKREILALTGADLDRDPASLGDALYALSLFGGAQQVRLREARNKDKAAILHILQTEQTPTFPLVIEAPKLGRRDALIAAIEKSDHGAVIGCYDDSPAELAAIIDSQLAGYDIRPTPEIRDFLHQHAGDNRQAVKLEIEKLALFCGDNKQLEDLARVRALISGTAQVDLDGLALAVLDGNVSVAEREWQLCQQSGQNEIAVLRVLSRHIARLLWLQNEAAQRGAPDEALQAHRPPIFFKHKARIRAQMRRWSLSALHAAYTELAAAELACKQTGAPAAAICQRSLIRLASSMRA